MDYGSARQGAHEALSAFENLRTPRGQAACVRLLAMIAIDTDDCETAQQYADRAAELYEEMGDPWGVLEARLLHTQIALVRHDTARARALLEECSEIRVEEAEPRQHYLLTEAWLEQLEGNYAAAIAALDAAAEVFGERSRVGDHTPHLLARLSRLDWPVAVSERTDAWIGVLNDRACRLVE